MSRATWRGLGVRQRRCMAEQTTVPLAMLAK